MESAWRRTVSTGGTPPAWSNPRWDGGYHTGLTVSFFGGFSGRLTSNGMFARGRKPDELCPCEVRSVRLSANHSSRRQLAADSLRPSVHGTSPGKIKIGHLSPEWISAREQDGPSRTGRPAESPFRELATVLQTCCSRLSRRLPWSPTGGRGSPPRCSTRSCNSSRRTIRCRSIRSRHRSRNRSRT